MNPVHNYSNYPALNVYCSLQNGIFALELLPRHFLGTLVVLTDGVVALRDNSTEAFDSILTLFSRYSFPLNFIQVCGCVCW